MVIVYTSFPLLMLTALWNNFEEIENRTTRYGPKNLEVYAFFFRLYSPDMWWVSFIDVMRRLALSALLILIEDKSVQLVVALLISLFYAVVVREVGPHWDGSSDMLAFLCAWSTTFCVLALFWSGIETDNGEQAISPIFVR